MKFVPRPYERARAILTWLCALFCAACGGPPGAIPPTATPPTRLRQIIDVRTDKHPERTGEAAYGYVVFRYKPQPHDDRDRFLCNKVFAFSVPRDSTPGYGVAATYWPSTTYLPPYADDHDNCEALLKNYDLEFAHRIITQLWPDPRADPRWVVFLVAQAPAPFGSPIKTRVCVDLTNARDRPELEKGFANWQSLMTGGPQNWEPSHLADYIHRCLTWFFRRDVYVDCK